MLRALFSLVLLFTLSAHAETIRASRWELHSSFWMSLHHALIEDASRRTPRDLGALSAEEQAIWNEAVGSYRTAGIDVFGRAMGLTTDGLTQVTDDATEPLIDAPLAATLLRAAPVYRKHWWSADDKSARFFIAYASAMLRDAGDELVAQHSAVYRTPWPQRIRLYLTPYGGSFGAYTMFRRAGGNITVMSSRESGYQGLRALEMILHEGSHSIVNPNNGTVAAAIAAAAKKRGITQPADLWHAILFATSSELTRRLLAARGHTEFVPSSADMFTRVWPKFREPIEKHWYPYLNGQGALEEAIDRVVDAVPR